MGIARFIHKRDFPLRREMLSGKEGCFLELGMFSGKRGGFLSGKGGSFPEKGVAFFPSPTIIVILLLDRCQRTLFKTPSVLLGDVPTLPGVDEAYVQVGTGRGAPW